MKFLQRRVACGPNDPLKYDGQLIKIQDDAWHHEGAHWLLMIVGEGEEGSQWVGRL